MKEAYKNCLENSQLNKIDPLKHVAAKELKEAEFDLEEAHNSFENQNYKWPIIESYYSCFHAARCLLFLIGLKEKSHFCVYAALSAIFDEYFDNEELENYKKAMQRRELADYYASYSKEETESAINFTEKFIKCQKFSTDLQSVAESQCHSRMRKISEHAQEPPDVADHSNIPPVYDWRFLTKVKTLYEKLKDMDPRLLKKARDSLSLKVLDEEKQDAKR